MITRRSYGFRTYEAMRIALYDALGRLPEPESTHRILLTRGLVLPKPFRSGSQQLSVSECGKAAWRLNRGVPAPKVARLVGVHRQSINRWVQQLEQRRAEALKSAPGADRPSSPPSTDSRSDRHDCRSGSVPSGGHQCHTITPSVLLEDDEGTVLLNTATKPNVK